MKKLMMGAVATLLSVNVMAVDVTVQYTTCSGGLSASNCEDLDQEIRDAIGEDLPDATLGDYGVGIANAGAFAQRGLTSDYSDIFTIAAVKGGLGVAVSGDIDSPETADGFGLGAAASIGVNLDLLPIDKIGPVELKKMDLFISFMSYSTTSSSGDSETEADLASFGLMSRYQIVDPVDIVPGNMLQWGGVYIHTGIQTSSMDASIVSSFDNQSVEVNGDTAEITDTTASLSFENSSTSIPFEVSTYLRTAWAFTFFGGAGFDYIVSSSTDVAIDAEGTAGGTGAAAGNYASTISASEDDSAEGDTTNFRAFGGMQLNLPFTRVTFQLNKGLGSDLMGINTSFKFLF